MNTRTKTVEIYSTPNCHFCHLAKEFFDEHGVSYTEYDVASNAEKRIEMMQKTGQLGVPVISIGEDTIVGYSEDHIRELLGIEE